MKKRFLVALLCGLAFAQSAYAVEESLSDVGGNVNVPCTETFAAVDYNPDAKDSGIDEFDLGSKGGGHKSTSHGADDDE